MDMDRAVALTKFLWMQRVTGFAVSDNPVLDHGALAWFVPRLGQAKSYLEFGSGGSTMLAARLGVQTVTVENDHWFARAVRRRLPRGADNRMLSIDTGITMEWGMPIFHNRFPQRVRRWRRYIEQPFALIAKEGRPFPDLVLIDGRFRRACALRVAQAASRVGARVSIGFDDYGPRPFYQGVEALLGAPTMQERMAVFEIDGTSIHVPQQAVDEAALDPA